MELKKGMYVRIQWGNGEQTISKCETIHYIGDSLYSKNDFYIHTDKRGEVIYKSHILKASNNIIDLIEGNDLLEIEYEISTGEKQTEVVQVIKNFRGKLYVNLITGKFFIEDLEHYQKYIKSIVTKEQFESMSYKVN